MNKTLSRIIIGVTLLLIIGVAAQYAYTAYPSLFGVTPEVVVVPVAPQLAGSLIMTLQPSIPLGSHAAIYAVSPQTGSMKKIDDTHSYFAPSFSSDGRVAVATSLGNSAVALALVKVSDKDHPTYVVPPTPALFPGAASWSSDNKYVVYEAITALPTPGDPAIENSRVVLLDTLTNAQKMIDVGVSPLFLKDGSILYIKQDGIYRIDAQGLTASSSAKFAKRVAYFEGYEASRRSKLALSHDNTKLLITHPSVGLFAGYSITVNQKPALVSVFSLITREVLYPVFAPDDRSVSYVEVTKDADGHFTKTLMTADTRTFEAHKLLSLAPYTDVALSLAAWIQ